MNPFSNPLFSFFIFIAFVLLLAAFINFRQTRANAAIARMTPYERAVSRGFVGTEEEWTASLTRRERRQIQFADQTDDDIKERALAAQARYSAEFHENIVKTLHGSNMSFNDKVNNILAIGEREITAYRHRAHKQDLVDTNVSMNDIVVTVAVCNAIVNYALQCRITDMGCIGVELMKFVETNMRVRHLNGVLYRNKGTVTHSQRCSAMAHAIIKYFHGYEIGDQLAKCSIPFDYLPVDWVIENEEFRRRFFQEAIDKTYRSMMKAAEQNAYGKTERIRNQEHENNRKHRRRRVSSAKNRI